MICWIHDYVLAKLRLYCLASSNWLASNNSDINEPTTSSATISAATLRSCSPFIVVFVEEVVGSGVSCEIGALIVPQSIVLVNDKGTESVGWEKTIDRWEDCDSTPFRDSVFCSVETCTVSGRICCVIGVDKSWAVESVGVGSVFVDGLAAVVELLAVEDVLLVARESPRLMRMSSAAVFPCSRV